MFDNVSTKMAFALLVEMFVTVGTFSVSGQHNSAQEQVSTGNVFLNSSRLTLAHDTVLVGYNDSRRVDSELLVGVVFQSLSVPQGATITNAYCLFVIDEVGPASDLQMNLSIYGELIGNASIPTSTPRDLSRRPQTSAVVEWAPNRSVSVDDSLRTVDISPVLQVVSFWMCPALTRNEAQPPV